MKPIRIAVAVAVFGCMCILFIIQGCDLFKNDDPVYPRKVIFDFLFTEPGDDLSKYPGEPYEILSHSVDGDIVEFEVRYPACKEKVFDMIIYYYGLETGNLYGLSFLANGKESNDNCTKEFTHPIQFDLTPVIEESGTHCRDIQNPSAPYNCQIRVLGRNGNELDSLQAIIEYVFNPPSKE